ncbi:hypothetical protein EsDP_00005395 [Epichloe bromicola]|uniref:phosphatidylinositol-3,4,5-trisphosphate 3-phosphatase n=1 Tax=Epichloe bromicola TaxID=79588 RepID=A0ABQ0CUI3_9HYPO
MASLLRQIVAGPRARHPEAGLDLCYVTDFIIATSGPSQTYPQLAYRNPLDQLVAFLDSKHGRDWAIWEFRAEGTGYPDEAVYGRVRHYPWPDHHPPPFRLVPMIMASMRNWLHGGHVPDSQTPASPAKSAASAGATTSGGGGTTTTRNGNRVVVVHCKAGKGRSGTMATSYLISEEGWTAEEALERFTSRRMRPKFGAGVSIPSQLRWVSYVDRWTRHGKKYLDRPIEIVEIHVWGLRNGVKVDVGGFVEDGKTIRAMHTFSRTERLVVEAGGAPPREAGIGEMLWDLAGHSAAGGASKAPDEAELAGATNPKDHGTPVEKRRRHALVRKGTGLVQKVSANLGDGIEKANKSKTSGNATTEDSASTQDNTTTQGPKASEEPEPGGLAVILKPWQPIRVPTSDVNVSVQRRNGAPKGLGLAMVSAVAHVWFNTFFEGQGPEQGGRPSDGGIFSIDWEAMDGIKGSSRKGSRALDRMSVVWRAADNGESKGEEILEPAEGEPVPQAAAAADWKGRGDDDDDDDAEGMGMEWARSSGPGGEDLVGNGQK